MATSPAAVGPPTARPRERRMFVFIIGSGRCGTTLVHELLCRHPETGFVSNVSDKLSMLDLDGGWTNRLFRAMPARPTALRPMRDSRGVLERGRLRLAPSEGWN